MSQALIRFLDYRWSCRRCHRISSFLRKTRWIFPHFLILILLQTKWISKDTLLTNKITQVYFHKTETFFFDSQCFKIPQKVTFYNIASEASYFYVLPINLWFLTFFMILKIDFFFTVGLNYANKRRYANTQAIVMSEFVQPRLVCVFTTLWPRRIISFSIVAFVCVFEYFKSLTRPFYFVERFSSLLRIVFAACRKKGMKMTNLVVNL